MQLSFRVKKQWRFLRKAGMHAATSHVGNKNVSFTKSTWAKYPTIF